jgi:hypothetical protein
VTRAARLVAAAVIALIVTAPTAAHAGDAGLTVDAPDGPLFDAADIFPGWAQRSELQVGNDTDAPAAISLEATDIVDLENGCNHPESLADDTCDTNGGELGEQLLLTLYADADGDGQVDPTPAWSGTLRQLTTAVPLASHLASGASTPVRIDAALPLTSGNETQTDQVAFDLRISLAGDTVVVEGARHTRTPEHGVLETVVDHLPFTGTPADRLVAGAGWTVGAGLLLMLLARRRRPRAA